MARIFSVRQPIMAENDPQVWDTALEISRHRSYEAAQAQIAKATRALQRQPGNQRSYLDWHICQSDDGGESWELAGLPDEKTLF